MVWKQVAFGKEVEWHVDLLPCQWRQSHSYQPDAPPQGARRIVQVMATMFTLSTGFHWILLARRGQANLSAHVYSFGGYITCQSQVSILGRTT